MILENGQFYTGIIAGFEVVELGKNATKAMEFTLLLSDRSTAKTTCWLGSTPGKDGRSNNDRMFDSLVKLGCDQTKLQSGEWRSHMREVLIGKEAAAKAEEYNGRVNLKGLYSPIAGGGKPVQLAESPFASASITEDDLPF